MHGVISLPDVTSYDNNPLVSSVLGYQQSVKTQMDHNQAKGFVRHHLRWGVKQHLCTVFCPKNHFQLQKYNVIWKFQSTLYIEQSVIPTQQNIYGRRVIWHRSVI